DPFTQAPPLLTPAGLRGHPHRDRMEPARQRSGALQAAGAAGQQQEYRLKGVLRRMPVSEYPAAYTEHQAAVSAYQLRKRILVALAMEPLEQVEIRSGLTPEPRRQQVAELAQRATESSGVHGWHPSEEQGPLERYWPRTAPVTCQFGE